MFVSIMQGVEARRARAMLLDDGRIGLRTVAVMSMHAALLPAPRMDATLRLVRSGQVCTAALTPPTSADKPRSVTCRSVFNLPALPGRARTAFTASDVRL